MQHAGGSPDTPLAQSIRNNPESILMASPTFTFTSALYARGDVQRQLESGHIGRLETYFTIGYLLNVEEKLINMSMQKYVRIARITCV